MGYFTFNETNHPTPFLSLLYAPEALMAMRQFCNLENSVRFRAGAPNKNYVVAIVKSYNERMYKM